MTLEAANPGAFAALRPWIAELEEQGWTFEATRGERRGLVYRAERRSQRGDEIKRYDDDLRRLVRRCLPTGKPPPAGTRPPGARETGSPMPLSRSGAVELTYSRKGTNNGTHRH